MAKNARKRSAKKYVGQFVGYTIRQFAGDDESITEPTTLLGCIARACAAIGFNVTYMQHEHNGVEYFSLRFVHAKGRLSDDCYRLERLSDGRYGCTIRNSQYAAFVLDGPDSNDAWLQPLITIVASCTRSPRRSWMLHQLRAAKRGEFPFGSVR